MSFMLAGHHISLNLYKAIRCLLCSRSLLPSMPVLD